MTTTSSKTLMDASIWTGKIFNGSWIQPEGGEYTVREPATGATLGTIGRGIVHINDQTINDEAVAPFGGVGSSGTGSRLGGAQWNRDAFTETQRVTMRGDIAPYPGKRMNVQGQTACSFLKGAVTT